MENIGTFASELWKVWAEMFSAIWPMVMKTLSLTLWIMLAIVILPCVFIAGNIYPIWEKWGEDF